MKSSILAIAFVGTSTVFAAPTGRSSKTTAEGSNSSFEIQWGPCPEGSPDALECGQLEVPIDWSAPEGEKTTLGMGRVKASGNASDRIGSLMFNPGGPGGIASDFCTYQASGVPVFSEALALHFDIICPDPRGVGSSSLVKCDAQVWNQNTTRFPANEVEFEQMVKVNKERGESCLNETGNLLKHIDTTSAARDIEAIRLALDDGKLNWLGLSYGSQLGGAYAELYPGNIRVMALDGITNHAQSPVDALYTESTTYENVLKRFFNWCATNATACGLQGENISKTFDDLVVAADKSPIPAPGCEATADTAVAGSCQTSVAGADIRLNVQGFLAFKESVSGLLQGWDYLGLALNQTIADNNATLLATALAVDDTSSLYADLAIACLDWLRPDTSNMTKAFAELQEKNTMGSSFNSHVGAASQTWTIQSGCLGWPAEVVNPQHGLDQRALQKAPPILLVNAKHDPETSYTWALGLKEQIPHSALVTRDGNGHTSYLLHGEATALMDTYLVEGMLPADGTVVES